MNYRFAIISSIAAAAVLATVATSPASANTVKPGTVQSAAAVRSASEASADSALSAKNIAKLQVIESAIASAGGCSLPVASLSGVIASLSGTPLNSATGVGTVTGKVCANINAVANPNLRSSALTSMWAWGNSVAASDDARGLGEAAFAPASIAAYSASKHLTNVRLATPWASDQGSAIPAWLSSSVAKLHANGQTVSALGGDNAWATDPSLVATWIAAAHNAAAFDGIQLDVEPWSADPNWTTNASAIASYVSMVKRAETTAHVLGLKLGIDAPWWLSTTSYGTGTVLSAILPYVDSVSIVAFADHAGSTDGVIAQAWPAVVQANASLTPFTIGVQTSSDSVAGGSAYTFADKGSAALETESNKVRAAYSTSVGYSGVTVEEYLSWLALSS